MNLSCSPIGGVIELGGTAGSALSMTVEPAEVVFGGHFPGFPIFPGVCIVEYVRRGALAAFGEARDRWQLASIDRVRFVAPVVPGDAMTADLQWRRNDPAWTCSAAVRTARGHAAQVRITFAERRSPEDD